MTRSWSGQRIQRLRDMVITEYGTTCWLCHKPIDLALAYPHPGRISVDHVIPRSQGGTDSLANLRPAHLRCNEQRGARPPRAIRRSYRSPLIDLTGTNQPDRSHTLPSKIIF